MENTFYITSVTRGFIRMIEDASLEALRHLPERLTKPELPEGHIAKKNPRFDNRFTPPYEIAIDFEGGRVTILDGPR
jgi:hypothetical protein